MLTLLLQCTVLSVLLAALILWLRNFPYPSPLIRWLLPPRVRWPEAQIRGWIKAGRFHPTYLKYFYRDPVRIPPPGAGILAPADGILASAAVRGSVRYLVIALSFWDMHVQYFPVSGRVTSLEHLGRHFMDGEGRNFAFLQDKICPVQKRLVISAGCATFAVRLITSLAARRIEVWASEGDTVVRGDRLGRILLGSTVVLELPSEYPIKATLGQHVRAGETVVADAMPEMKQQ